MAKIPGKALTRCDALYIVDSRTIDIHTNEVTHTTRHIYTTKGKMVGQAKSMRTSFDKNIAFLTKYYPANPNIHRKLEIDTYAITTTGYVDIVI